MNHRDEKVRISVLICPEQLITACFQKITYNFQDKRVHAVSRFCGTSCEANLESSKKYIPYATKTWYANYLLCADAFEELPNGHRKGLVPEPVQCQ